MPVADGYQKRSLDELGDEAVRILARYGEGGCNTGEIGSQLFPDAVGAVNCSCPYARIAGRVLHRLKRKGLVRERRTPGWVITAAGRDWLAQNS